jgi:adenylylsulfate kinase-like enzyme
MTDAGIIVITAFLSPFSVERKMVPDTMLLGEFIEIYIDTPLVAPRRQVVGGLKPLRNDVASRCVGMQRAHSGGGVIEADRAGIERACPR